MSIALKIVLGSGAVLLLIGSTVVSVAVLFQPKDYMGEEESRERSAEDRSVPVE